MKRCGAKNFILAFLVPALILGVNLLAMPRCCSAGEEAGKAQFNVNTSMMENLVALKGKTVTVTVATGQTITGTVGDVKGNLLHLMKLSQRDFFDALVAIDRIAAIETRVRER